MKTKLLATLTVCCVLSACGGDAESREEGQSGGEQRVVSLSTGEARSFTHEEVRPGDTILYRNEGNQVGAVVPAPGEVVGVGGLTVRVTMDGNVQADCSI